MRFRLLILFALLALLPARQARDRRILRFGGTFIGAVVVDDGIVFASDTRSTFIDNTGKQFGYIDGMPKLFVQHGAAFAISGLTSVSGELINSFVARNDYLLERPVDEILFGVMLGLPFRNSTKVMLISAGFANGQSMICAKNPIDPQLCRNSGFITNRDSPSLSKWLQSNRGTAPKPAAAAAALHDAIMESSGLDATVGGPISVLHLRKSDAPEWLENAPKSMSWKTVCDIISDYRKGQTKILFTNTKDELDRNLDATCPK